MTTEAILKKHKGRATQFVLISEVTRMSGRVCCVAGLNIETQRMVRPLQSTGSNWDLGNDRSVFREGNLLGCEPNGNRGKVMPHATEDTPLGSKPKVLDQFGEDELYALLLPSAKSTVVE